MAKFRMSMWQVIFLIFSLLPVCFFGQDTSFNKKIVGVTLSLPWINNYTYYNHESHSRACKLGFLGIGASLYYKRDKNKSSLNFGITGDLLSPTGRDLARAGTRTSISAIYIEGLLHRNIYNRINLIGGINLINYRFAVISSVDTLPEYIKSDMTLGLTTGIEYSFFKSFSLALFYRPALVSFGIEQYKHLISLDGRFDIISSRSKINTAKGKSLKSTY